MTAPLRVVIDSNVLVAAARSRQGASFALVSSIPSPQFQPCLSVALYTEWLDAVTRPVNRPAGIDVEQAAGFVRFLARQSHLQEIHFLWRPFLADVDDDMVLELALAAGCPVIITHNVRDFAAAAALGVTPLTPREFLHRIRTQP